MIIQEVDIYWFTQHILLLFSHKAWHNVKNVQIALQSRILLLFFSQHGTMLREYGLLQNQPYAQRYFLDAYMVTDSGLIGL